jgi:hypothetical protein
VPYHSTAARDGVGIEKAVRHNWKSFHFRGARTLPPWRRRAVTDEMPRPVGVRATRDPNQTFLPKVLLLHASLFSTLNP